ncbi:MAG: RHS repeat-associated core domain-containing protein [Polyangiaceae bacterium]|nr:RHS repeat-associated core domain-containing protein [Polyangiaceae bacterium]
MRKVWQQTATAVKERIYLGAYEIYREKLSGVTQLERQTLHVMDGVQRIAMVETKTIEGGAPIATPVPKHRFQLGNHLGSAMLEVDETGLIISYEEYHPYGTSAYRSARSGVEVSARRYRYTGKERDEETGLYYHGARYYAAWLGRWTSADPLGIGADGPGLYNYARDRPSCTATPAAPTPSTTRPPPSRRTSNSPSRSTTGTSLSSTCSMTSRPARPSTRASASRCQKPCIPRSRSRTRCWPTSTPVSRRSEPMR